MECKQALIYLQYKSSALFCFASFLLVVLWETVLGLFLIYLAKVCLFPVFITIEVVSSVYCVISCNNKQE